MYLEGSVVMGHAEVVSPGRVYTLQIEKTEHSWLTSDEAKGLFSLRRNVYDAVWPSGGTYLAREEAVKCSEIKISSDEEFC